MHFTEREKERKGVLWAQRTWAVLGYHLVNDGGFDAVHDVVACAGHEVAVPAYLYIFLSTEENGGSFSF